MRKTSADKATLLTVRRDHRINRPQNPYQDEAGPPTPTSPNMTFSEIETDMTFSGSGTVMEYTQ